jgi:predicted nucleic acid-binding protein
LTVLKILRTGLTAYDAAYLQLALELRAPLATFDKKLGQTAQKVFGAILSDYKNVLRITFRESG